MLRVVVTAAIVALAPAASASAASVPPLPSATVIVEPTVQQNPAVLLRDGTYSAAINGKSYWAFNDTGLTAANASGQNFFSNSLSWSTSLTSTNGIVLNKDQVDSSGLPSQFIPFTAGEAAFNSAHALVGKTCQTAPCGEGLAIWPGPIVYNRANKQVIIPFVEIVRGRPIAGYPAIGGGISIGTVTPSGFSMTRPTQSATGDRALMWSKDTQIFTDQAFLYNGYYYAYGDKNVFVTTEVVLGRVPVSQVLNLSAWTYYTGNETWGSDVTKAVTLFDGSASGNSVFFDAYLKEWVAISSQNFTNNIYYAVANAPEGPWSDQTLLTVGISGYANNADYATRAHPEFSPDGGKTIDVTYVHSTGAFGQNLPAIKVVFGPPADLPAR